MSWACGAEKKGGRDSPHHLFETDMKMCRVFLHRDVFTEKERKHTIRSAQVLGLNLILLRSIHGPIAKWFLSQVLLHKLITEREW